MLLKNEGGGWWSRSKFGKKVSGTWASRPFSKAQPMIMIFKNVSRKKRNMEELKIWSRTNLS